jgi:hypothetical protein
VPLHAAWARPHLGMLFRSPSGGPHYNWSNKRGIGRRQFPHGARLPQHLQSIAAPPSLIKTTTASASWHARWTPSSKRSTPSAAR